MPRRVQKQRIFCDESEFQFYAVVEKKMGDRRFQCKMHKSQNPKATKNQSVDDFLNDKASGNAENIVAKLRGCIRKNQRVEVETLVLLSMRENVGDSYSVKADIIEVYTEEEKRGLIRSGKYVPESTGTIDDIVIFE